MNKYIKIQIVLIVDNLKITVLACLFLKSFSSPCFSQRSFETQLSRVEAELLRREAPPSYGQLIAQGLIPPVEDFPVCPPNQVCCNLLFVFLYLLK